MTKLAEYILDFNKTMDYIIYCLKNGNELAEFVLSHLNFHEGNFTAFSSDDINISSIYDFKSGGLIKADYENRKSNFMRTPNIDRELSKYLFDKYLNNRFQIIFEDAIKDPDYPDININNVNLTIINNHVFYIVNKQFSEDLIFETLKSTQEVWYSFFVITSGLEHTETFSPEDFPAIVNNIKQFFIGAYDGEGYVAWTRK